MHNLVDVIHFLYSYIIVYSCTFLNLNSYVIVYSCPFLSWKGSLVVVENDIVMIKLINLRSCGYTHAEINGDHVGFEKKFGGVWLSR